MAVDPIVIEVDRGSVTRVYRRSAPGRDLVENGEVIVRDFDNIKEGASDPLGLGTQGHNVPLEEEE